MSKLYVDEIHPKTSGKQVTFPERPAFSSIFADETFTTSNVWHTLTNFKYTDSSSSPHVSFAKGGATLENGVFTAPLAGTYVFHANLRIDTVGSGYLWTSLSVNDSNSPQTLINEIDGSPNGNYTTHTMDGIYHLEVGDTVRVKILASSDSNYHVENYSLFQGYYLG